MPKKTAAPPIDWRAPRLAGKAFVLGRVPRPYKDLYRRAIEAEGGRPAQKVSEETDFIVIRKQRSLLDRDVMSTTFLRYKGYKGAEAGGVDWRPAETIPEDYYTL
jgi:hypothetical protein